MRSAIVAIAAFVSSVSAVGNAIVRNKCPSTFYLHSVGASIGPEVPVPPGMPFPFDHLRTSYSETLYRDPVTGGIAIKITKRSGGLEAGDPVQIVAYTLDPTLTWYDLSSVHGDPFAGSRLTLTCPGGETIEWPRGVNPDGPKVKICSNLGNVVFTACA